MSTFADFCLSTPLSAWLAADIFTPTMSNELRRRQQSCLVAKQNVNRRSRTRRLQRERPRRQVGGTS